MKKIRVLLPLPSYGFDPSETAIPWKLLSEKSIQIIFATPNGNKANADQLMLDGKKLGIWKSLLRARKDALAAYLEMEKSEAFGKPLSYNDIRAKNFDAVLLPGGHHKGVREYLESEVLQKHVLDFFIMKKPVAAICHGVVLAARTISPETGKSVLYNYKTTSLLKSQELLAYNMTRVWLKDYYLTYPDITVEDEVCSVLQDRKNFYKGSSPLLRDDPKHLSRGFSIRDKNYLSARWPGDVYRFSMEFIKMLEE